MSIAFEEMSTSNGNKRRKTPSGTKFAEKIYNYFTLRRAIFSETFAARFLTFVATFAVSSRGFWPRIDCTPPV